MTDKEELAALKQKVAALEARAAQAPPPTPTSDTSQAAAKWRDEMRELSERRANSFRFAPVCSGRWTQLAALPTSATSSTLRTRHARQRWQGIPSSQTVSGVHPGGGAAVPGNGTGWRDATPLGPPPGIRYVDAQIDAQDRRDKAARIAMELKS